MEAPDESKPRFERVTTASIAQVVLGVRTSGQVFWPWPPSIVLDDPDINIETYLIAAMNYIEGLAVSGLPRCEQDRRSLDVAHGLIENGLLLSRARRMASGEP